MFLSNTVSTDLSLVDATVIAVLGYAVVFFGLILLMLVVMAMGKAFTAAGRRNSVTPEKTVPAPAAPAPAPAAVPAAASAAQSSQAAPGSAGKIKLHDVPPKTAAMLMAIVADQMGKPLNELRFISIKEVK